MDQNNYTYNFVKNHRLFQGLTEDQLLFITKCSDLSHYSDGVMIIKEGEIGEEICLVLEGNVEVIKEDPESKSLHKISTLQAGDVIGEIAFLEHIPRSSSVRSVGNSKLLWLHLKEELFSEDEKVIYFRIVANLSKNISQKLRKTGELTVKTLQAELEGEKERAETGKFLFFILVTLSSWVFIIDSPYAQHPKNCLI